VPPVAASVAEYVLEVSAAGSVVVVICNVATDAEITMLKLAKALLGEALESVTSTVKAKVPDCVGVPLIAPEAAFKLNPAGKDPDEIDQAYGVVPPLAASAAE
jgi:hypothetical protein